MKKLISLVIGLQFVFFNTVTYASVSCKQALTKPVKTSPLIKSYKKAGRRYLDTSGIRGLENLVLEHLPNGGMVTAKNGAFTCTHCGTLHKVDGIPKEPEFECENCSEPVKYNQKSQPPMVIIKHKGQIYVSEHNIVRDKAVVEYFEKDAVGCKTCSTLKLDPEESCTNCGDTENVVFDKPPVATLDWGRVKRNPKIVYPALIKMGLMDPVFARAQGYMSAKELFEVAEDLMSDGQILLEDAIKRGLVDPKGSVQKGWLTIQKRRFAIRALLDEGFVSASTAIVKGWIEKPYAIEKGYITESQARELQVEMTPYELFETAMNQVEKGDITLAEAIKEELIDPKRSVEEGWLKLKDRREAVLDLINQGYILVEQALERGWMVRDFAINQGLIEADKAQQIVVPEVKGKSLSIQAQQRNEDFGEESPMISSPVVSSDNMIPTFRNRTDQPFTWSNVSTPWKKVIKVGIGATVGLAISAFALFKEHVPESGPVAFGEVIGMHESLVIYDSEAIKLKYSGIKFNIESPPEGVRVVSGEIGTQIKVSSVKKEETEAVGQLMSVLVLDVNDAEIKIYKQGSVQANFSDFEIGENLPVVLDSMFQPTIDLGE